MPKALDLTGQRFGRLVAIRLSEPVYSSSGTRKRFWVCKCDCGNTKNIYTRCLVTGKTRSCGCLNADSLKLGIRRRTHGLSKTKLYKVWVDMKRRCYNSKRTDFKYYGAEGKRVCKEWRNDFDAFKTWALDNGYHEGLTIDRIDYNKGYSPSNCRWVDMSVQVNNRRSNHNLTYKGETKSIADWAREYGLTYGTLISRVNKLHWPVEAALLTPVGSERRIKNGREEGNCCSGRTEDGCQR